MARHVVIAAFCAAAFVGVVGPATADSGSPERAIAAEVYPFFFLAGGGGGGLAYETDHWTFPLMGFAAPLSESFRDAFLTGASEWDVALNWGIEVGVEYYLFGERRGPLLGEGPFAGALVSLDGFHLNSGSGSGEQRLHALYLAPRLGYRWSFFDGLLFIEPAVGSAIRLREWIPGSLDRAGVSTRAIAPLYFFEVGTSIGL